MMRLIIGSVGSSPLTRGTHLPGLKQKDKDRFIPAYAGNSGRPMSPLEANTVHPRLRGELSNPEVCRGRTGGSSPLTRGTQEFTQEQSEVRRFIPAYAGNSATFGIWQAMQSVHPRLRGELERKLETGFVTDGSSPLTRGTHIKRLRISRTQRFIPAYAGNSLKMVTTLH